MSLGPRNRHQPWVLVVEDNPDDERLATRAVGQLKNVVELIVARNGEEALEILREAPAPNLVLLDLKLPRLSGVEVLMSVRDDPRLKIIPIVVLTSSDEKSDRIACYELGCNAFIKKPIEFENYLRDLKITLEFWLKINLGST